MKSDYFRSLVVATFVLLAVLSASQRSFLHATTEYDESQVGVIFFGDSGKGNSEQRLVGKSLKKFCETEQCDFVTLLGDNFYPAGVSSVTDPQWNTKWWDIYQPLGLVFFAALGNHDHQGDVQAQVDYTKKNKFWYMPQRYYTFQRGPAEFFVLDTDDFTKTQAKWLDKELTRSSARVKVVFGHHPIYSYGSHGDNNKLIRDLLPTLRNRATIYLAGHDHDKQMIETAGDPPMAIVGTAAETRPVGTGTRSTFSASTLGFGHLTVTATDVRVRFIDKDLNVEFERVYGIRARGE